MLVVHVVREIDAFPHLFFVTKSVRLEMWLVLTCALSAVVLMRVVVPYLDVTVASDMFRSLSISSSFGRVESSQLGLAALRRAWARAVWPGAVGGEQRL